MRATKRERGFHGNYGNPSGSATVIMPNVYRIAGTYLFVVDILLQGIYPLINVIVQRTCILPVGTGRLP